MKIACVMMLCLISVSTGAALPQTADNSRFYARPEVQLKPIWLPAKANHQQAGLIKQIVRAAYGNDTVIRIMAPSYLQQPANQLKKKLVASGIAADHVNISLKAKNPSSLNEGDLEVVIETLKFRQDLCRYNRQDYRYFIDQKMGCAMKHNLQNALVDPGRKIF